MRRRALLLTGVVLLCAAVALALSSGPNFPTAATGNTNAIGGGTQAWTNPANIEAADSVTAGCSLTGSQVTDDLIGTGFGFSIPAGSTINGILLEVSYADGSSPNSIEKNVRLLKAGAAAGSDKSTFATLPAALTTVSYGGSADLWGTTWIPADINASNFGAATNYANGAGTGGPGVDFFRITVTYTPAPVGRRRVITTQTRAGPRDVILALSLAEHPAFGQDKTDGTRATAVPLVLNFRTVRSLMLVIVTVDGKAKTLIFDTGAERTIIQSSAGDVEHRATLIVGTKTLSNFPLIMENLSGMSMEKVGADGVLGEDFLRKFSSIRIDRKAGTVELEP